MWNTNKKGTAAVQVLRNGPTYEHYASQQNGACWVGSMSADERSLLAMGATGSEALHREINGR